MLFAGWGGFLTKRLGNRSAGVALEFPKKDRPVSVLTGRRGGGVSQGLGVDVDRTLYGSLKRSFAIYGDQQSEVHARRAAGECRPPANGAEVDLHRGHRCSG